MTPLKSSLLCWIAAAEKERSNALFQTLSTDKDNLEEVVQAKLEATTLNTKLKVKKVKEACDDKLEDERDKLMDLQRAIDEKEAIAAQAALAAAQAAQAEVSDGR